MREVNGRTRHVNIFAFGVRADQVIHVAALELVRVFRQSLGITYTVIAGPGLKHIPKSQSAQRGVAARAAAGNHQSLAIYSALLH